MKMDQYVLFMKFLSDDSHTPEVAPKAIATVAGPLRIGRVSGKVEVEPGALSPMGENKTYRFFEASEGADEDSSIVLTRATVDNGFAMLEIFHAKGGEAWSEEDEHALRVIGDAILLHLSRHRLNERLQRSAYTQYLTGLPNSGGFLQQVGKVFKQGQITRYDAFYYNLKGMGFLNMRYSQRDGDDIIRRHAQLLHGMIREGECIGHLGGDNFVALILKERSEDFLDSLLGGVDIPITFRGESTLVTVTATVGMMHIDESFPGPWAAISGPSSAAQIAKETGQSFVILTREMMEKNSRDTLIENTFHTALAQGQFQPYYQPKVNMKTGEIVGAEVLARWIRDGHVVAPPEFIPVLEKCGAIVELDMYMLEQACIDMREWMDAGEEPVPVSINFSRRDLEMPHLAEHILECIERQRIDKKNIIIEVTETADERENTVMMQFLSEMSEGNIPTSIDDFGTGFSSLSFLRDFPTSEIKIDRSFINHEVLREKDKVIIGNIVTMARQLGVDVITEGVEKKEQVAFLLDVGCERAQGYLYDKPLPRDEFKARLLGHAYRL